MLYRNQNVPRRKCPTITQIAAPAALLLAGCITAPTMTQRAYGASPDAGPPVFAQPDTLDQHVPTPASVIGHEVGDGAVRYDALVQYLNALADASPFVAMTPYGTTHEGRTLYYLTITSAENHTRLAQIQKDNSKLADPRKLDEGETTEAIEADLPGIAWMAYSIHGDELSSTDAATRLAYELAAGTDEKTQRLREELVIHIDPLMNPDGRERYLSQLQTLAGAVSNPDYQAMQHRGLWSAGRGNHYLFDLNRDWLMLTQPETRGRVARILAWHPHLVVDSHEMGALDTYLFDPPREPINRNLSERTLNWRRRFSAEQARAFDRHGWSYYTQDWYEEWYPGYTNAWANLLGAVGLLYEQAGVNGTSVRQAAGHELTYREAVEHQFVSSMANLETLRANRSAILADFAADHAFVTADTVANGPAYLFAPPGDRARLNRLLDVLQRHGVEMHLATAPVEALDVTDTWGQHHDTLTLPAATIAIRTAQPHRRLIEALLEFDPPMTETFLTDERKELENHRSSLLYDVTAWNLPMAYGIHAYRAGHVADGTWEVFQPPRLRPTTPLPPGKPAYGYVLDGKESDIYQAVVRLMDRACKVRVAAKPFRIARDAFTAGAVLLRNHENPDDVRARVAEAVAGLSMDVHPVNTALCEEGPDLGGREFELLARPRVAIATQWPISTTSFGATWHLLDTRIGLRCSPVNIQSLSRLDLRRYNVLILPDTWGSRGLAAVLGKDVLERLKTWIDAGGTLIAFRNTAAFLAAKERAFVATRLRREVLDELDVYAEAVERERAARDVHVDADLIWNTPMHPVGSAAKEDGDLGEHNRSAEEMARIASGRNGPKDAEALERLDKWRRRFSPSGVMLAASLDPEHWLCHGLGDRLPVFVSGSYAFVAQYPVATPVRIEDSQHCRLNGLLWPEARERLADTAYVTVERSGNGQIILFATDPFFRGYLEGSGRLLLNAVINGPGLGTRQPVPW